MQPVDLPSAFRVTAIGGAVKCENRIRLMRLHGGSPRRDRIGIRWICVCVRSAMRAKSSVAGVISARVCGSRGRVWRRCGATALPYAPPRQTRCALLRRNLRHAQDGRLAKQNFHLRNNYHFSLKKTITRSAAGALSQPHSSVTAGLDPAMTNFFGWLENLAFSYSHTVSYPLIATSRRGGSALVVSLPDLR